jgi:hypothetical protein
LTEAPAHFPSAIAIHPEKIIQLHEEGLDIVRLEDVYVELLAPGHPLADLIDTGEALAGEGNLHFIVRIFENDDLVPETAFFPNDLLERHGYFGFRAWNNPAYLNNGLFMMYNAYLSIFDDCNTCLIFHATSRVKELSGNEGFSREIPFLNQC